MIEQKKISLKKLSYHSQFFFKEKWEIPLTFA